MRKIVLLSVDEVAHGFVASHPSRKNKYAARVGHPTFFVECGVDREVHATAGREAGATFVGLNLASWRVD